jgi:hypothetical protein
MHLFTIPQWAMVAYGVGGSLYALRRGGPPQRAVAAAVVVGIATECGAPTYWTIPDGYSLTWDTVVLATCVICALRSDRYWTIAASSFALLEVVTDLMGFVPGVSLWAYLSADRVWTILLVASLLAGTWRADRAQRPPRVVGA